MVKKLRVLVCLALTVGLLAGCGSSVPSDATELQQACKTPPPGASYDYAYQTINKYGITNGIAECSTDGTVSRWDLKPNGSGDNVRIYNLGQHGI